MECHAKPNKQKEEQKQTPSACLWLLHEYYHRVLEVLLTSHLSTGIPDIGIGSHTCTVRAHVGLHNVLDHKALLQDGPIQDLPLHCQLDFQPPGVWLCPDEPRIYQLDLPMACQPQDKAVVQYLLMRI